MAYVCDLDLLLTSGWCGIIWEAVEEESNGSGQAEKQNFDRFRQS